MKIKNPLLSILFMFIILNCYGQKTYYLNVEGKIFNQKTYYEKRKEKIKNEQSKESKPLIFDEINGLHKTKKCNIYSYVWHFTDDIVEMKDALLKKRLLLNKEFPVKNVKTLKGEMIDVEAIKGKPTLIVMWSVSDSNFIKNIRFLNRVKEKYAGRINFIAITNDSLDKVNSILKKQEFSFKHIVESKRLTQDIGFNSDSSYYLFLDDKGVLKKIYGNLFTTGGKKEIENCINTNTKYTSTYFLEKILNEFL